MKIVKAMERSMGLNPVAWERHANPWSVWTRYSVLPLFVIAIWSRVWLGWWCLLPVALVMIWTRVNPHLFPAPASTDSWASRAVMGERVWLNRAAVPIPAHHAAWALRLSVLSGAGLPALAWGLWALDVGWTLCGVTAILIGKSWFLDRMAWLFDDMADQPAYAGWLR